MQKLKLTLNQDIFVALIVPAEYASDLPQPLHSVSIGLHHFDIDCRSISRTKEAEHVGPRIRFSSEISRKCGSQPPILGGGKHQVALPPRKERAYVRLVRSTKDRKQQRVFPEKRTQSPAGCSERSTKINVVHLAFEDQCLTTMRVVIGELAQHSFIVEFETVLPENTAQHQLDFKLGACPVLLRAKQEWQSA